MTSRRSCCIESMAAVITPSAPASLTPLRRFRRTPGRRFLRSKNWGRKPNVTGSSARLCIPLTDLVGLRYRWLWCVLTSP